jgi:hypothetical protein
MTGMMAARPWLTVCRLALYAYELNPLEPVRSHRKRSLAKPPKNTMTELTALVKTSLRGMQYRRAAGRLSRQRRAGPRPGVPPAALELLRPRGRTASAKQKDAHRKRV